MIYIESALNMAGYSGTPLTKKLGIKPGYVCYVLQSPSEYFDWLSPLPQDIQIRRKLSGKLDFIHLFVTRGDRFREAFLQAKKCLKPNGMLWVSWPKKSSKVETDLDENRIRDFGLKAGLVDIKVCAVDDIWSGLKFVVRKADR